MTEHPQAPPSRMETGQPGLPGYCTAAHVETGARCELPAGHVENHRGRFAHGIAQWPPDRLVNADWAVMGTPWRLACEGYQRAYPGREIVPVDVLRWLTTRADLHDMEKVQRQSAERRIELLRDALAAIAAPSETSDYGWWVEMARKALRNDDNANCATDADCTCGLTRSLSVDPALPPRSKAFPNERQVMLSETDPTPETVRSGRPSSSDDSGAVPAGVTHPANNTSSVSPEIAAPQEDTLRGFIAAEIVHATELTTNEVASLVDDILAAIREHERQRRALASRASSQEIAGK